MDCWFILRLLCGLLITASVNGHRHHNLTRAIETLQKQNGLLGTDWVGKAVFATLLGKQEGPCTCEKLVLLRMLNVYTDIFMDMLHNTKGSKISLNFLLRSVEELKTKKYAKVQVVWKQLQEISNIETQVKNSTIQGGAVIDFLSVYHKALTAAQHDIQDETSGNH